MWSRGSRASISSAVRPPAARARLWLARDAWRRWPLILAALFVALLALDALLYQVRLPVAISDDGATLTVAVAGAAPQRMALGARIVSVAVPPHDPLVHEYQLDGTDSTNNFTLDTTYLQSIANTPYYRFYAWMRNLDGLSRWRDLCAGATCLAEPPLSGARLTVSDSAGVQRISAQVQQPETPLALALTMSDGSLVTVTIDRNDHFVNVTRSAPGQPDAVMQTFFPTDAPPFAAMTADFLTRLALWALALLALVCGGEWLVGLALGALGVHTSAAPASADEKDIEEGAEGGENAVASASVRQRRDASAAPLAVRAYLWLRRAATRGMRELAHALARDLTEAIHPIGLLALLASFLFTIWIALAQYHAMSHIYDATAYLFGARIFAAGRIFAPIPPALDRFPGPFMLAHDGKWFQQYDPGAPLALAVGVRLGVPWLVEPLLGTMALLGIGLIARRLYNRRVATLAVLLGALSPFYSYLAASYLSHTVALFYLVWGWWALLHALDALRSGDRGGSWYLPWLLPLAGLLWTMALLTRETSAIFIAVVTAGALWLLWLGRADRGALALWRDWRAVDWRRWVAPALLLAGIVVLGVDAYLGYSKLLTGSATTTPRHLFSPGDHFGFGQGVGFYGQHTLASGFINVDELLTSLAINLYGWPFYLTLAFLLIPFLARRARAADLLLLVGAAAMTFAFIGFYYHGIYLGPRYLFEALPFFLILTARGLLALAEAGAMARERGRALGAQLSSTREDAGAPALALPRWVGDVSLTGAVALALLACLFGYFLPRQIALHTDFTGMAAGRVIQMSALENPPVHHALVVTSDAQLYGYTLFAMNDPLLRGDVIYAEASGYDQYAELRRAFPDRQLYILIIRPDGKVVFAPLDIKPTP